MIGQRLWVLRHELKHWQEDGRHENPWEDMILGAFTSRGAGMGYVLEKHGFASDEWIEGDPDDGYWFLIHVRTHSNGQAASEESFSLETVEVLA